MAETSKTVNHALAALLELSENGAMSPAELAQRLGLNRTVVHRLLATLHERGFVTRGEDGYVPGSVLIRIASRVQPELRAAAADVMADLARAADETVVLHIADGDDAVVLDQHVASWHVLRVEHHIGSRHPLSSGASGRALLAYLPQPTIARVLRRHPSPERLTRQLEQVQALGYAISHDELQNGVHGLAVPIVAAPAETAEASLAVIVPSTRAGGITEHIDALHDAAARIVAGLHERR